MPPLEYERFFESHVEPAFLDWQNSSGDLRLAMNLASSLNIIAEYYWHGVNKTNPAKVFNQRTPRKYREELANQFPPYGLIRDVADSHKHLVLDRSSASVSNAQQVGSVKIGYGQAYGICYGGGKTIQIELNNGQKEYFSIIARDVYEYWKKVCT